MGCSYCKECLAVGEAEQGRVLLDLLGEDQCPCLVATFHNCEKIIVIICIKNGFHILNVNIAIKIYTIAKIQTSNYKKVERCNKRYSQFTQKPACNIITKLS